MDSQKIEILLKFNFENELNFIKYIIIKIYSLWDDMEINFIIWKD